MNAAARRAGRQDRLLGSETVDTDRLSRPDVDHGQIDGSGRPPGVVLGRGRRADGEFSDG
ncbi:MAG: hypothetical protein H7Y15_17765 [Pseudonocardia sp.]|nr:hypothetical protein [Pseudonocardia sp.]